MKVLLALTAVAVLAIAAFAAMPIKVHSTVSLSWDYDPTNSVDAFKLYSSTDPAVPVTSWPLVATVSSNIHNITLSNLSAQQSWFFVTASNLWGEGVPSVTVGMPQPPAEVTNLRISQ